MVALVVIASGCGSQGGPELTAEPLPQVTTQVGGASSPAATSARAGVDSLDWQRCELVSSGVTVSHPDGWHREELPMRSCATFAAPGADLDATVVRIEADRSDLAGTTTELLSAGWRLLPGVGLPPGIALVGPGGELTRLVPIGDGTTLRFTSRPDGPHVETAALVVRMATSVRPVRVAATPGAEAGPGATPPAPTERAPRSRVRPEPGNVALTFDDGPHPTWTPIVLDLLDEHDATATFFVVGSAAERYPDLVREIVDRGHSVQNHTQDHERLTEVDDSRVRQQLRSADRAITDADAPTPKCVRPPYGAVDERVRDLVAGERQDVVLWNVDTLDWRNPGVDRIIGAAVGAEDRDIVLFHDGPGDRSQTVAALPWVLEYLSSSGFGFQRLCADPPPG